MTLLDMDPNAKVTTGDADAALRRRLVDGDSTALELIYDVHGAAVYRLALRVTRDTSAAEDVTQEVFVTLWQRPERFDAARGSLRTYLSTIAHRRSVDFIRANEARRAREERVGRRAAASASAEDRAIARVDGQAVKMSLWCLPLEQRKCLELAYLRGLSFREVATELKIPEGTAKSRIRLGLKRLHTIMSSRTSVGALGQGEPRS